MKHGNITTIPALMDRIDTLAERRKDFVVPTRRTQVFEGKMQTFAEDHGSVELGKINDHAQMQIAQWAGIPIPYMRRMLKEAPVLAEHNMNAWLSRSDAKRLVRTYDTQTVRAFLSDRYRRIDHVDVMKAIGPVFSEQGGLEAQSLNVDDTRLFIKVTTPRLRRDVRVGDTVEAGVMVKNSEVGLGAYEVCPILNRLVCNNGMVVNLLAKKRRHVGGRIGSDEDSFEIYQDDTLRADDEALMLKMRDIVRAAFDPKWFNKSVDELVESTEDKVTQPNKTIERVADKFQMNSDETDAFMAAFINGGDATRYGVIQAVTRASQDIEDYSRATELEAVGGQILTLEREEWRELAEAA